MPQPSDPGETHMRMLQHAVAAGAFFFVLQRFAMKESLQVSLLWAVFFAVAAAFLSWQQSRR
ncbi:MAG: hypothetical protein HOP09_09625 [Hyphomicrobium sp.]|nr:hypothetical protein [Hyphomicrobium sp.]